MRVNVRDTVTWLRSPADDTSGGHAVAATFLRVLLGLMWLYNVAWKRPPEFGESTDSGLYHFTAYAVEYPVLPPFSFVVEKVVLPNIAIFGWGVLVAETALAVMLLTGAWVRLAAVLGAVQSLTIGLSVAFAPNEWPWSYWLMIGAHVLLLFSVAGRYFAVDAVRAGRPVHRLPLIWGGVAVAVSVYSIIASFDDPLAARGPGPRSADLSVSLGNYNVIGGLVLFATGALLVVAGRSGRSGVAWAATGLGVVAALLLHAQLGFSDPLLGGNATSAAVFLSLAVVAGATAAHANGSTTEPVDTDARRSHQSVRRRRSAAR